MSLPLRKEIRNWRRFLRASDAAYSIDARTRRFAVKSANLLRFARS